MLARAIFGTIGWSGVQIPDSLRDGQVPSYFAKRLEHSNLWWIHFCRSMNLFRVVFSTAALGAGFLAIASATKAASVDAEMMERGKQIYAAKCASCHGEMGVGVAGSYEQSLTGDASITELTDVISRTMPEDDPGSCTGDDAKAVSAYVHETFYGVAAQVRNRPPRVALARLTAEQLRQSIADLYATFGGVAKDNSEHGLQGLYFNAKHWKEDEKKITRNDAVINFDWGHESPGEGLAAKEFFIYWNGSLIAEQTGNYEIIVRSTCAFEMDFGSNERQFIDNHVQSGDKTEFRRTIHLTGGRAYPIEISMNQRERKDVEQPPASIKLSWIPPHGTEEIIPSRVLRVGWSPAAYPLQASLPPDDRSYGYDRGTIVNRQWDESTTNAALEFASVVETELWKEYQNNHKDGENRIKLRDFLVTLVGRAFRSNLTDEEKGRYVDQHLSVTEDDSEAIRRVILVALKSPRFLYPALSESTSASQRASARLSLMLHDSLPNENWIIEQASKDSLSNQDQVRGVAREMIKDYRVKAKVRNMLYDWLDVSRIGDITKDNEKFPGFSTELIADLRASLDAYLDDVVWSDSSDFRQFFLADWTYTNKRMHEFYGEGWQPADPNAVGLTKSVNDPEKRFGVLTHPLLTSGRSYFQNTSPIHRGVFMIRNLFGRVLRPPNEAFTPISADLHPSLTTRERVALQTSDVNCQVCHSKINGLGFILENYDAVGRYRTSERDKPIDATGIYLSSNDQEIKFSGVKELATYLAESEDSQDAFVERVFEYFVKQPVAAYGVDTLDQLKRKFKESNYNIRDLLVEVAVVYATSPHQLTLSDPAT